MKRDLYLLLIGFFSGIFTSIYLYRKRKKILDRLSEIERKIKGAEFKSRLKSVVWETTASIRKIVTNTKGVPPEEKEYILKKVEEKIRRLEEIV